MKKKYFFSDSSSYSILDKQEVMVDLKWIESTILEIHKYNNWLPLYSGVKLVCIDL
jgi:hypothetical protein